MIRPAHPRFSFPDDDQGRELICVSGQPERPDGPPLEDDAETINKIKKLPKGLGVILMTAGIAGVILPGPIGTPLLFAGGLVLAPKIFGKLDKYMKEHLPVVRHHGVQAVDRFIDDLEKRYPSSQD